MRLVFSKSTFDHPLEDSTVGLGQPLILEDELAAEMNASLLTEPPRPEVHMDVETGPVTDDGLATRLFHKGGGSYLVIDANGKVLNDSTTLRGEDEAREFAVQYFTDSDE